MRAAALARTKVDAKAEKEKQRDATADAWLESVSTESFHPQIAPLWARELLKHERAARDASQEAQRATKEREKNAGLWQAALKRADLANEWLQQGIRRRLHKREEIALQNASDGHLHRRRRT